MKKILLLLALVGAVLFSAAPVLADDGFYVVAVGGGVGTKITSLPYEIKTPGFYYLTGNLTYSGTSNGITVSSNGVTLDLMGFCLSGPGSGTSANGINIAGQHDVEVRNGSLQSWYRGLTDSGSNSSNSDRNRALNLRVSDCSYAINFWGTGGGGNLVKGCSVEAIVRGISIAGGVASGNTVTNGLYGIAGSGTISGNSATNCSVSGIFCVKGSSIIGNTVVNPSSGTPFGIYINTTDPCLVTQNTVSGPGTPFDAILNNKAINVANTNAGF